MNSPTAGLESLPGHRLYAGPGFGVEVDHFQRAAIDHFLAHDFVAYVEWNLSGDVVVLAYRPSGEKLQLVPQVSLSA